VQLVLEQIGDAKELLQTVIELEREPGTTRPAE
jgi:hypothetical protein